MGVKLLPLADRTFDKDVGFLLEFLVDKPIFCNNNFRALTMLTPKFAKIRVAKIVGS